MPRTPKTQTPHNDAVSIIEKLVSANLGGVLEATANCNQCSEELTVNIVAGATSFQREKRVGTVRPDISLLGESETPVRFIEVVDSHAPERNVHAYALEHGIEVIELHLGAQRAFTGKRMNKALDESLTIKTRLQELADGILQIDAHNLLCQRPKCKKCASPLPLRTVIISTTDCWNCDQNVNVAVGRKDDHGLVQDDFTQEEREFANNNGVKLERRFSATVGAKYLANVCTHCDQIQGNWYLYEDPYHDRFNLHRTERTSYGPCDKCATRYCPTHDEYYDYDDNKQCPACLEESERVMCPNRPERECFYPLRCKEGGCYFLNREQQQQEQQEQQQIQRQELDRQQQQYQEQREQRDRERQQEFDGFQEWFRRQQIGQDEESQ